MILQDDSNSKHLNAYKMVLKFVLMFRKLTRIDHKDLEY